MTPVTEPRTSTLPPADRSAAVGVGRGLGGRKRPHGVKAGAQLARQPRRKSSTQRGDKNLNDESEGGPALVSADLLSHTYYKHSILRLLKFPGFFFRWKKPHMKALLSGLQKETLKKNNCC